MSKVARSANLANDQPKWMTHYVPAAGAASALAFSVNVMNPRFFRSLFSPHQLLVANSLWFNAHIGTGLYLYSRRHISAAGTPARLVYSLFGAVVFNFGTVLVWATTKSLLPRNDALRTVFGLLSGVALFVAGKHYLGYVDDQVLAA